MKRILIVSALIVCVLISGCTSTQSSGKGTLQFSTSPEGAQIYLDNQYQGTTPSTLTGVSMGAHALEFRYTGYQSWDTNITVNTATSTYYAALTPLASQTVQPTLMPGGSTIQGSTTGSQPIVTIQESQIVMTIGSTQTFSGTCAGSDTVLLVLYGPGAYANGMQIAQVPVSAVNTWSYVWNPGNRVISGTYTMIAFDKEKISSATATFSVVGGGLVSIISSSTVVTQGDTVTYSGLCTTGANSVILTLYGPGQFSGGVQVATLSLNADNTYSYKYTFDLSRPVGSYTMVVNDQQNTASASVTISLSS
ncbi:PEGA domain-containing protein [Methanoregula sp.]|uniref:PEGA domain-containing protein n=1 Tax=Methanoregula sp. TaxID=2052170 RepID=UPI003BAFEE17